MRILRSLVRSLLLPALLLGAQPADASVFDLLPQVLQGTKMPHLPSNTNKDGTRTVTLNGFPLRMSTGRTDRGVAEVLDYYQARYQGGAMKDILGQPFVMRRGGPDSGTLLTVEVPDQATAKRVLAMEQPVLQSGPLRMVQARRVGLSTDYMILWSDRPVPPEVLGPVEIEGNQTPQSVGDAPGNDPPKIPRPPGRRSLSFVEEKAGYHISIYEVDGGAEGALANAASRLSGAGFEEDTTFGQSARSRDKKALRFVKGNQDVVVVGRSGKGGAQLVYLSRNL